MGCRFAWVNDRAARAAAKFCDIVSYNRYSYSVEKHRLPDGIDKPTIIGEFHFGALDRGMFHTGLKKTANQQDRAADILFFWIWSLLLLFFIISSAFGRTICWGGIRYKLLGPTETIVISSQS